MRKSSRIGAAAGGALAIALMGASAAAPVSQAGAATASHGTVLHLSSIRPSSPMKVIGAAPVAATLHADSVTSLESLNWAGYVASFSTTTFRFVSTHFNVPQLDCRGVTASTGAWSAHWVGLDGFRASSSTLEQIGLLAICENSTTPVYALFWEMFPLPARVLTIPLHPGDAVTMSVFFNPSDRLFTLQFADTTDGQQFKHTRSCPSGATCQRNSAEAISEAPFDTTTKTFLPLADFAAAAFDAVSITNTTGTHRGGLKSSFWNTFQITEAAGMNTNQDLTGAFLPQGTIMDTPTPLFQRNTFLNYWNPANAG
jgi:hypothetical protein